MKLQVKVIFLVQILFVGDFAISLQACKSNNVDKSMPSRPNVLLIIADDFNYDSAGFAGGVAPDVTPNLDRLAAESYSFEKAFTTVSVCQPARQSMLSGLIPNHYGSGGFFPMKEGTPTLPALLREAGYLTGNIHKKHHMLPTEAFNWVYDNERLGLTDPDGVVGRDPQAIAGGLSKIIKEADKNDQAFFMVVSSADSHRPFHGDPFNPNIPFWGNGKFEINIKEPSRIYKPEEIIVPPTLPDIPEIRNDLAKYASSVRRLDDTVGECLNVLDALGKSASTLVIFVSDNGMPLPYGKFDCFMGSNRSPFLMRWPEGIKKPVKNKEDLVSLMDITPTVLELANLPIPSPMDGKSLVPFIKNKKPKDWRESIVFIRNEDIYYGDGLVNVLKNRPDFGKKLEAMGWVTRPDHHVPGTYSRSKEIRTYYDGQFGYIYNNCYKENGLELGDLGAIVPYKGPSLNALNKASKKDKAIKERYESFLLRAEEELYDWTNDPGSLHNLANNPKYAAILAKARKGLLGYMRTAEDPLTEVYQKIVD